MESPPDDGQRAAKLNLEECHYERFAHKNGTIMSSKEMNMFIPLGIPRGQRRVCDNDTRGHFVLMRRMGRLRQETVVWLGAQRCFKVYHPPSSAAASQASV